MVRKEDSHSPSSSSSRRKEKKMNQETVFLFQRKWETTKKSTRRNLRGSILRRDLSPGRNLSMTYVSISYHEN